MPEKKNKQQQQQEFRLQKIEGRRNYLLKEIDQNECVRNMKKFVEFELYWPLIVIFTSTRCVSFSAFSLVGIPLGITRSAIGLKICAIKNVWVND